MAGPRSSAATRPSPTPRKPAKRRVSAEEREITELLARIDSKLERLHEQTDAILRDLEGRRGA
jgi:peptide subunit release factor RF-3